MEPIPLSDVCLERLEAWLLAHVASAIKDREFVDGLRFIIADEVTTVARSERERAVQELLEPSIQ